QLAESVGISRSHLFRKLKSLAGQNPNEFIKSIRLNHAAQLLSKKKYSVSEIAYHVGFNDPKYFGKCFRHKFEMSPTDYSHKHLGKE
ncbi:helix-turn-helix transcriptional regulator, partial [Desulfosarcina sp.]|nr:helix-turn-helix transcriptional regulator [Desulfosarcina sp.]